MSTTEPPSQAMPSKLPCVLLLNGFPGVGKLTTAKVLTSKLQSHQIPHRLIDNHLLIDPVLAIEPDRNEAHYTLRKEFRTLAMTGLARLPYDTTIIWTAALATSHAPTQWNDVDQLREYLTFAEDRGVMLVFVNIVCDLLSNCKRVTERKETSEKVKLFDADVLTGIRRDTELLSREVAEECAGEGEGRMMFFELDNSGLDVEEGADQILRFLRENL
ncbi:hypothetical protein VTL71DRAFT_2084 [Oculimacula yallundae]|uniref:Uncharacterized protein n=1 Tax=Oculimacula yallundae TaxID=86028 RepID=A0ABR4C7X2_9HELO